MIAGVARSDRLTNTVEFIDDYRAAHEVSPTFREIMAACGQGSLQTVKHDLARLVDAGRLRWAPGLEPGTPRTILPNSQRQQHLEAP
jgi:SOS-response transcriptional repressor LexA